LRNLGAEVVELPAIRIEPTIGSDAVKQAVEEISEYTLIVLTSPNGVRLLFEAMREAGLDARALGRPAKQRTASAPSEKAPSSPALGAATESGTTVAAIGPGTARALAKCGISADIVPERFVAESLVEALDGVEVTGKRVLVARAADARDVIPEHLEGRGAEVDVVALYKTVREEPSAEAVEAAQSADYVTFTSSSTVRNLTEALGDRFPSTARIVSIGPVTSEAVGDAGLEVDVEAERHDIDGLIAALLADAR
jgi:uroporphyrinogen III methyltransferase/synthase